MASNTKRALTLTGDMPVGAAIDVILRHHFEVMLAHQEMAYAGTDLEGVHQMRVALRRLRSALSLFSPMLDRDQARGWRERMRELAGQLGRARDLDVFIDEGLADTSGKLLLPGEGALRELALRKRAEVYASDVRPMLESDAYQRFCAEFPRWIEQSLDRSLNSNSKNNPVNNPVNNLDNPGLADNKRGRKLARPIIDRACKLLDKQDRRVLNIGNAVDRHDAPAMHQLRIETKKLRYATEFFRPLFTGMGQFIGCLKGIQNLLGIMNDLALTQSLLDDLLSASPEERDLQCYAGALIGWRSYHFHHLLEQYDDMWDALVTAERPWRDGH